MKFTSCLTSLFCLILLAPLIGCGSNIQEGHAPAAGTITIDGEPLKSGTIVFTSPQGAVEGVAIITEGKFEVKQTANISGMKPGEYQVTVESWIREPGAVNEAGEIVAEGERAIPEKFSKPDQSGLTLTVPAAGSKTLQLALNTK